MPAAFLMSNSGRHRAPDHDRSERCVDQDAKTEDLLLAGLDCYFAARYKDAIHVWSRALFFDRDHARARRALAERQRESEELGQMGADTFRRGDIDTARTLLMSAIERGGVQDDVQVLLERLGRLQAGSDGVAASPLVWARPSASEIALARAQALYDAGRFHEALSALSRVRSSSTVRADADALQTIIQRALIAGVSAETR